MTKTYSQLVKQIDVLKRQADDVRKKEVSGVVSRMKSAIDFYGLTPADLFGATAAVSASKPAKTPNKSKSSSAPKFRDSSGNVWSGRGPRPQWLRTELQNGKSLNDFAVESEEPVRRATVKTAAKKYVGAVRFRDGSGNQWSGRGPKPQWVKDALSGGKTMQDLAA